MTIAVIETASLALASAPLVLADSQRPTHPTQNCRTALDQPVHFFLTGLFEPKFPDFCASNLAFPSRTALFRDAK